MSYRTVLRSGEFRAVLAAHVCAMLAVVVGDVALTVLVYQRTGSPLLAALTFATGFVPMGLGALLLGDVGRARPTRDVLVACELVAAVLVLLMALPGMPVPAILGLLAVKGTIDPIFAGRRAASLPELLGDDGFPAGRSLLRVVSQNAQLGGFAVGGFALVLVTPSQALLAGAAAYAAAALVLLLGTRRRPTGPDGAGAPVAAAVAGGPVAGLRALFAVPGIRPVLALSWLPCFFAVAPEALATPYAHVLGGGPATIGLLLTGLPAGMVLGETLVSTWMPPAVRERLVTPMAAAGFVPVLGFAFGPPLPVALGLLVLAGLSAYLVGLDQIALATVPPEQRQRGFALLGAGMMVTQGLGFAAAGALAEVVPVTLAVTLLAAAGLATVVAVGRSLPASRDRDRAVGAAPYPRQV